MPIVQLVAVSVEERPALGTALDATKRLRDWQRLQSVHVLELGRDVPDFAEAADCSSTSV